MSPIVHMISLAWRQPMAIGLPKAIEVLACAVILTCATISAAAIQDDFESPEPSWRIADADCSFEVLQHLRTFQEAHSGRGSEHLRLRFGQGTYVHLVHDVTPSRIIAELLPQVWIKTDRTGLQFYARAVLPRSRDKKGQTLTVLLPGTNYEQSGVWRQLVVRDIQLELERQVRILRHDHGPQVDAKEAYIDMLVINAYGGPGSTELWIDDLQLQGVASNGVPIRLATFQDSGWSSMNKQDKEPVGGPAGPSGAGEAPRMDGSVLLAGGRPLFARAIEHQGESFAWLAKAGFNVIRLAASPTAAELAEAKQLGIWLIAPPPPDGSVASIAPSDDRVIAWILGDGLTRSEQGATRLIASRARALGGSKPLACGVNEGFTNYAEIADVVVFTRETLGTSFPLSSFGDWMQDGARGFPRGAAAWASVESEIPPRLESQIVAMSGGVATPTAVEPLQVEMLVAEALASGARGIYFRSRARLDLQDTGTRIRAATLQLVNRQLALVEPWGAGGTFEEELSGPEADTRIRVLQTQRARLLVITQHATYQQFAAGPWRSTPTSFAARSAPITDQAFLIGPSRLEPLRGERASGMRIGLDSGSAVALAMLTQEPLAINHIRRKLAENAQQSAAIRQQLTSLLMSQTSETDRRITSLGQGLPQAQLWLTRAEQGYAQMGKLLQSGDVDNAWHVSDQVTQTLHQLRRAHWDRAVRAVQSPCVSPLLATYDSLPRHWQLISQMNSARWQPNSLAGGDFENLDLMLKNGWQQVRSSQTGIQSTVELSFHSPREGRSCLHLQAWTERSPGGSRLEDWPVSIITAPVPILPNQMVRIHGWVNVAGTVRESREGVLIADTIGGLTLAERIFDTKGWQEFTFYRIAPNDQPLAVTMALTGLGEAWFDDLSITIKE